MNRQGLQQQPDFEAAARALEVVVDNVKLCSNIPAVDSGAALERKMDALMEQMVLFNRKLDALDSKVTALGGRFTGLDGKFMGLDGKFTGLDGKVMALDGKVTGLDGKVTALDGKVTGLDGKVTALDKNSRARAANSIVISPLMELTPMHNVRTGEEISDCPSTLGQLEGLSMQELARLLRELGEPVPRAERERRRLVKLAFGLRTREV
ncbi:uncharacterized protein G6M90_00g051180 [Metarhizium brunneum]|uniref:Uncharacterized protein n=1 Tax=Metarhizium brunneum TaxID=500148 RepID=A0A7D5YWM6_9HYPO|nr:hypothetical protein G6M90_00g051180 [Metarhizium brunneum]